MVALRGTNTSGSVTTFNGSSGLLRALLNFIVGTEVTGENLTGSDAIWAGTLANFPVGLGRLTITYVISGVEYTATDDGSGNITGTNVTTGTLDNETGAYAITFSSPVTGVPTADYLYGEPGRDWKKLVERTTQDNDYLSPNPTTDGCVEVILHNTGQSGQENIYVGIHEYYYAPTGLYGWDFNIYNTYTEGQHWNANYTEHGRNTYDSSLNSWTHHPQVPMINDTMYYWFYSSRSSIKGAIKVLSNYESFYLGMYDRYSNPSDHPYPIYAKGSSTGNKHYTSTNDVHRYIAYQGISTSSSDNSYSHYTTMGIGPDNTFYTGSITGDNLRLWPMSDWFTPNLNLAETPNYKEVLLDPVVLYNYSDNVTVGELEQVVHLAGTGLQSEDILNGPDGLKYRVFQDIFRTSWTQFMGIAESEYTTTSTSTTTTTTV